MHILLDAIPLTGLMTGISRYVRNLYTELEQAAGVAVHYYGGHSCSTKMPDQAGCGPWTKTTSLVWKFPAPAAFAFRAATWMAYEMRIRKEVRRNAYALYHETAFTPAAVRAVPQVVTIYDLSLQKYKSMHPKERVWFSDFFMKRRIGYAAHVITISDFIKSEICEAMGLSPEKVTAVPLAPDPFFFPRKKEEARDVVDALGLPHDYILFVGTLEPRKNLSRLIRAAAACQNDVPIVLVGWEGWGREALLQATNVPGMQDRVFTTGYVDEESLACLYSSALALVFPSLYEGFGLPVLEAMACGCPVICSNAASLPEAAGDAAIYIDPHSVEELTDAIDTVAGDSALRNDLIQKGIARAARFTWKRTAQETLTVFRSVATC